MTYRERLVDGEFFGVITDVFTDTVGEPIAALIFFGATGAAFYVYQQRAIIPLLMIILIGGTALATLPAAASRVVIMLVLLALASIAYLLYQRALGSSRFR